MVNMCAYCRWGLADVFKNNAINVPQWYSVQEGDATMMPIDSQPGQKRMIACMVAPIRMRYRDYQRNNV